MGEFLTRLSIWAAMSGWLAVVIMLARRYSPDQTRGVWTLACSAFVLHVLLAMHVFHDWSHSHALAETARQTRELTGVDTGVGLYINYAFTVVWVGDCVFWWVVGSDRYLRRGRRWHLGIHAFFVFMIFNGAVIFGHGPVRWFGGLLLLIAAIACLRARRSTLST